MWEERPFYQPTVPHVQARLKTLLGFHFKHGFHYLPCRRYLEQQGSCN